MATEYKKRLRIPLEGGDISFHTASGTFLARGYKRIVLGGRGPYVEFDKDQIDFSVCHIPDEEKKRLTSKIYYYIEHRTNDEANVKIYDQLKTVSYADYKVGLCYVSPFDLFVNGEPVITKLKTP